MARDRFEVNPKFAPLLAEHGLDSIDALFAVESGKLLTKQGLPPWRERIRVELGGEPVYLKRYAPPLGRRIGRTLRVSSGASDAADEWDAINIARTGGVAVPEPIVLAQRGGLIASGRSCLAIAELANCDALERWLPRIRDALSERRRRDLARAQGTFIARFHATGLNHRDLYIAHVFIDESTGLAGEPRLFLIDLARAFRPRFRRRRWIVKDLAQIEYSTTRHAPFVTRTDRLRFLHAYLDVSKLDGKAKSLARAVMRKSQRIAKRAR